MTTSICSYRKGFEIGAVVNTDKQNFELIDCRFDELVEH